MRLLVLALLLTWSLSVAARADTPPHPAPPTGADRCHDGGPPLIDGDRLIRTRAALRAGHRLLIVAIGSSSTQGTGASAPANAYPARLRALLQRRFPHMSIIVLNKGVGGENAAAMRERFARDVFPFRPDLVIWQTGTNDAIQRQPPSRFAATLANGLSALHRHGSDVVLMMPQYAPRFTAVPSYPAYLDTMRQAARDGDAALFDRFAVSRLWMADRRFAGAPVLTGDGLHQSDAGYGCVAELLDESLGALAP